MVLEIAEWAHTADENERATLIEEQFTDEAIEAVRQRVQPETHPDFDGMHCVECAALLPPARLALGRVRCVVCQAQLEREARLYRPRTIQI